MTTPRPQPAHSNPTCPPHPIPSPIRRALSTRSGPTRPITSPPLCPRPTCHFTTNPTPTRLPVSDLSHATRHASSVLVTPTCQLNTGTIHHTSDIPVRLFSAHIRRVNPTHLCPSTDYPPRTISGHDHPPPCTPGRPRLPRPTRRPSTPTTRPSFDPCRPDSPARGHLHTDPTSHLFPPHITLRGPS
jgi:hypothetical protein